MICWTVLDELITKQQLINMLKKITGAFQHTRLNPLLKCYEYFNDFWLFTSYRDSFPFTDEAKLFLNHSRAKLYLETKL